MKLRAVHLLVPAITLFASACNSDQPSGMPPDRESAEIAATNGSRQATDRTYSLEEPDVSFALAEELMEISGLTLLPDGRLGAVQDEEGILYALNRETGAIEARYPFGETGDYEGVETVGDRVFILRSNGTLLELSGWSDENVQVRTFSTDLKGKNDTEGLAYDVTNERLLIACKEDPGNGLDEDLKAIYAFDLSTGELDPEPAFVIDLEASEQHNVEKGKFKPSGLAVHPSDGTIYVISSVAKVLVVLNQDGVIQHVSPLPETLFEQPEGLAFMPDGTLFLASEGDDGPAMIYRYSNQ